MTKYAPSPRLAVTCVYCDGPLKKIGKGEHIIQQALGGRAKYLRCVCGTCNTTRFSQLDKELCSRSPLGVLAQQVFAVAGGASWGYDVDRDIALEARPLPGFTSPPLWPQLVLLDNTPLFAFDYQESLGPGMADFARAFWWCLRVALASMPEPSVLALSGSAFVIPLIGVASRPASLPSTRLASSTVECRSSVDSSETSTEAGSCIMFRGGIRAVGIAWRSRPAHAISSLICATAGTMCCERLSRFPLTC